MRRVDVDALARQRVHPPIQDAPAGKHEGVRAVPVDDRKLEIAVERRVGDRLPHFFEYEALRQSGIDLDQNKSGNAPQASAARFDLDQMHCDRLSRSNKGMRAPRPPSIRHCPLCGVAMQASKSREELPEFDTFRCLTCQTTIAERPRPPERNRR